MNFAPKIKRDSAATMEKRVKNIVGSNRTLFESRADVLMNGAFFTTSLVIIIGIALYADLNNYRQLTPEMRSIVVFVSCVSIVHVSMLSKQFYDRW